MITVFKELEKVTAIIGKITDPAIPLFRQNTTVILRQELVQNTRLYASGFGIEY